MSSVAERLQRKSQRPASSKQVRLKLVYIDFWSVVKLSFLLWLALGIVLLVATVLAWFVLNATGVFGSIDQLFQEILAGDAFSVTDTFGLGPVTLFAFLLALLNTVIGTALGAIGAVLYNLSVRITGGLLVGLQNS